MAGLDTNQIPARKLERHHRRARKALLEQWQELGTEHGIEDAISCFATLTIPDRAATHQLQRHKMAARKACLEAAGIIVSLVDLAAASFPLPLKKGDRIYLGIALNTATTISTIVEDGKKHQGCADISTNGA